MTISTPAADGVAPADPVQWWYWTGHLTAADGRRFGCEVCFFSFTDESLLGQRLRNDLQNRGWLERLAGGFLEHHGFQMAHCALTDVYAGTYEHNVLFKLGTAAVEPDRFTLALHFPEGDHAVAEGGGGRDQLTLQLPTWSLDLSAFNDDVSNPPALHYGGDRHDYACGGYTYYYSRPRMAATGVLTRNGATVEVSGTLWFDRQLGDLNAVVHEGWQWFAIELNDGRSIMLFDITSLAGETYGAVMEGSSYRALGPNAFTIDVLDHWQSPHTSITYPSQWRIRMGDERFIVSPLVADQEFLEPSPFQLYWEGDCSVALENGDLTGQAYVELNGFKRP